MELMGPREKYGYLILREIKCGNKQTESTKKNEAQNKKKLNL